MRNRITLFAVCAAFLLGTVFLAAQANQNVQITNGPKVENVTGNTATIAWSTNVNAGTVLKYGPDPNNLKQTSETPWGGLTHRVTLKDLQPNQTYYFQVNSSQGQGTGTGAISSIEQFKTSNGPASASNTNDHDADDMARNQGQSGSQSGGPDNAQVVVGPIMQKVTDKSAQVFWETTQPTENLIKYGTSQGQLTQTAEKPFGGQTHEVDLTNLQPNTLYYFAIQRPDGTVRTTGYFRTNTTSAASNPNAVQITDGPNVEYLADNKAIIAWSTNVPSSSVVKYGQDAKALNQTAQAAWGGTTHRVTLNNLSPNTRYWFEIQSGQGQGTGTMAATAPYTFQTIAPGQAAMTMQPH